MFGSWLLGFIGAVVGLFGALGTLGGLILGFGQKVWGLLVVGIVLIALGSFLRYLSKQTVRVRP